MNHANATSKRWKTTWSRTGVIAAVGVALAVAPWRPADAAISSSLVCPVTSTPTGWSGTALDLATDKIGVSFDITAGKLRLRATGANFRTATLALPTDIVYAVTADFDHDGWDDAVGTPNQTAGDTFYVLRNKTWINENCTTPACTAYVGSPPNWPATLTTPIVPRFDLGLDLHTKLPTADNTRPGGRYTLIAADFNGDGWADVFEGLAPNSTLHLTMFRLYLNNKSTTAPDFQTAYWPLQSSPSQPTWDTRGSVDFGVQNWTSKAAQAIDFNKDGRLDIVVGTAALGGSIHILLNNCTVAAGAVKNAAGLFPCSSAPRFVDGGYLITYLDHVNRMNSGPTVGGGFVAGGGLPTFAFGDVDDDGLYDLFVGAPDCCATAAYRLRMFKGCAPSTTCSDKKIELVPSQTLQFIGAATAVLLDDYSLDGKLDLIVGTDNWNYNYGNGGATYYWENKGGVNPFAAAPVQLTYHGTAFGQSIDFDGGFTIDYDRDPSHTRDVVLSDGNSTHKYYVLANRVVERFDACGTVESDSIDLGSLGATEMIITGARLTPTFTLNGGSIKIYASNEDPANWILASLCAGSTTDYCVTFPKTVGTEVRWRAELCPDATHYNTPTITSMSMKFDYTQASEHHRASVIVNDGVAYVGAFRQPGGSGRFYGLNAGLTTVYWEAGDKLDARVDAERNLYTSLATMPVRMDFTTASATDPLFRGLLGVADAASASAVVTWARGARFGVGNADAPLTRLGAVQGSTPALLARPGRPSWYSYGSALDRTRIDQFIAANATRVPLVLFGARDGLLHALRTLPTTISDVRNGAEAWGYLPPSVANRILADYTNTLAANAAATDGRNRVSVVAYPDGSPTLVDYDTGAELRTAAIIPEGAGGKAMSAVDVTQTVDPATGAVLGPTPMWTASPGGADAGNALSKPAVGRVLIGGNPRTVVVAATGPDPLDTLNVKGRVVQGYDLLTGLPLWQFQTACAVTSDITLFETDDGGEPDAPTLNGFVDRAVFADACGNVYKLNPAADLGGGWLENAGYGANLVNTQATSGARSYALFSTTLTTGALGGARPIGGTIAARTDATTRMVLFFGTGGLESADSSLTNAFFAVYADTGAIRSRYTGACTAGNCEKFYGGTLVTPTEVIFTRTLDPAVGSTNCSTGTTVIQAMQLGAGVGTAFVQDFAVAVTSGVVGALFGDGGALYYTTLAGDIGRVGTPRAANAGGDSTAGYVQGTGVGDQGTGSSTVGTTRPLTLMGWRGVL